MSLKLLKLSERNPELHRKRLSLSNLENYKGRSKNHTFIFYATLMHRIISAVGILSSRNKLLTCLINSVTRKALCIQFIVDCRFPRNFEEI